MKILKWIATTVLFVGVSAMLGLILFGFNQRYKETSEQTAPVSVPESINNLPVQDIKSDWSLMDDRPVISALLQDATMIDGFHCAAGEVRFTLSGRLSACAIANDGIIQGNMIPQNTLVELSEERNVHAWFFPNDTIIQDIPCQGGKIGSVSIPTFVSTNGRLLECYSSSNVTIQDIPCRNSKFSFMSRTPFHKTSPIIFRENGNLRRCTLSRDAEIDGQSISAGSEINISEDGEVMIHDDSWQRRTILWVAGILGY